MIDTALFKQTLKDASDDEAKALYGWATVCMEVRGLIPMAGSQPTRRRRSDAGRARTYSANPIEVHFGNTPNAAQPSLSGLPDENGAGE